ncbi:tyrosine-protein kinase receptor Tie-1-like [Patiria miniata]|uniref:Protein kinase domain-containing protein n=1 Tax=Patiria miniata TaxID=46514 RepID=A0A914ASL6_PATMI|nr:tyrosine-protein kinase receptor Tie-1-like [Patiria miniata]
MPYFFHPFEKRFWLAKRFLEELIQNRRVVYVALEYQPNGDLRSYLRNARSPADDSRSSLSAVILLQFAVGVAKGMQHVAASGVIHRKLSARNILLDNNLVAKVSGFGQARCTDAIVEKSKVSLPPRWLSLESLKTNTYTSKSNVYELMLQCWQEDPNDRPPFKKLALVLKTMDHSHNKQRYMQMLPMSESKHYLTIQPDQDDN